jgi:galactokinase
MQILKGVKPVPIDSVSVIQNLVSFTPGRVNLIGEHTDYNGGMVMPAALAMGLRAELKVLGGSSNEVFVASRSVNQTVCMDSSDISKLAAQLLATGIERSEKVDIPEYKSHSWTSYIIGCFAIFEATLKARHHLNIPWHQNCLSLILDSNLPQGAGLSSSAALCVSLLSQLNILSGAVLDAAAIARLAMYVEHRFAGTKCGLMDQLAVLCSRAGYFTRIDFLEFPQSHNFHISYARAHEAFDHYALLIFKTGVNHSLAESAYNERRTSCESALKALNNKLDLHAFSLGELARLPRFQSIETESQYLAQLESLLESEKNGKVSARRACHAMLENSRVLDAAKALQNADMHSLGRAMRESHASLDALYEVTCPELNIACFAVEKVVQDICSRQSAPPRVPLIGPRMTGGGFGGSTVQLVHISLCDSLIERFSNSDNPYTLQTGILPQLFVSRPSSGFSLGFECLN